MPEYDHDHIMTLHEYFSALDPFLVFVTVVVVSGFVLAMSLVTDAVMRAIKKEAP